MKDINMQSLMSLLVPNERDAVSMYLASVGRALGCKSDAALARAIDVRSSALANWKRRNVIPEDQQLWFRSSFIEKVSTYRNSALGVELEAKQAVVRLIVKTNGNPMGLREDGELAVANSLGGLLCLSQFLWGRMYDTCEDESEVTIARLCEMLELAMLQFRKGDHLRGLR